MKPPNDVYTTQNSRAIETKSPLYYWLGDRLRRPPSAGFSDKIAALEQRRAESLSAASAYLWAALISGRKTDLFKDLCKIRSNLTDDLPEVEQPYVIGEPGPG